MAKTVRISNKDGYSLLQVLRGLNDMNVIGKLDPTLSARRSAHMLNVLEDEMNKGLGDYADQLDQVIVNANLKFQDEVNAIPENERLVTDPRVQSVQKRINEEIERNAVLLGITPKATDVVDIELGSDDRAKFLNASLDQLAAHWNSRKAYMAVCEAVEKSLA